MDKLKWLIIWVILSKKERSLFISSIKMNLEYAIENYAMGMGETYQEFIEELYKINLYN